MNFRVTVVSVPRPTNYSELLRTGSKLNMPVRLVPKRKTGKLPFQSLPFDYLPFLS